MNQGHAVADPAPPMLLERMTAGEDEPVEMPQAALDCSRVTPGLGRPFPRQAAANATRAVTWLAIVLPEQVHRADQPVLMCSHDSDGPPIGSQSEDARTSDERDIVKVHDVGVVTIQTAPQGP